MKLILQIVSTLMFAYVMVASDLWATSPRSDTPVGIRPDGIPAAEGSAGRSAGAATPPNPWAGIRGTLGDTSYPSSASPFVVQMQRNSWQTWKNMSQILNSSSTQTVYSQTDDQNSVVTTSDSLATQSDSLAGRDSSRIPASTTGNAPHYFAPAWKALYEQDNIGSNQECISKADELRRKVAKWTAALYLTMEGDFGGSYSEVKSSDGKVKCKAEGPETQDYESCKTMIGLYDGARVAEVGVQGVQQVMTVSNQMDMQRDYSERVQEGDYAAGLKLQSETMELQRDQSLVQSGFHTTKLATLWGALEAMPTLDTIMDRCKSRMRNENFDPERDLFVRTKCNADPSGANQATAISPEAICQEVVTTQNKFIMNQQAAAAVRDEMIKAGFDAAKMAGMAAIYQVQKDKIDNAIDDLEEFEPSEAVLDPTVLEQAKCLADPTLEGCVQGIYDRDVGFAENVYNVGGTDGTNSVADLNTSESVASNGAVSAGATGTTTDSLGSLNPLGAKDSGIAGGVPGAARVRSAANSSPGGGGGSGGGASMASGGGAGGGEGAAGGNTPDVSKLKYGEGGTGALNYGRGMAAAPKKEKAENPFNSLFNKDKAAGAAGDVMEFGRSPASIGDKDGKSLFEMISGRYGVVKGREDLLIYEKQE